MKIEEISQHSSLNMRIPEHSLTLMNALSGGKCLKIENYIFYTDHNWLMAIGYPIKGRHDARIFEEAFNRAKDFTKAENFFAISEDLPDKFKSHVVEQDKFYIIGTNSRIPQRLIRQANRAAENLQLRETTTFTPEHRRLWTEFLSLNQPKMKSRVTELYRKTPFALDNGEGQIKLLDALSSDGKLIASLLLDYTPKFFTSYILGAHSKKNYVPHAMDFLFLKMIEFSRERNKRFINLGLGVNEGILRFKKKWKAKAWLPFQMAEWQDKAYELDSDRQIIPPTGQLALAVLRGSAISGRKMLETRSPTKPFAMIWEVEKGGRISWVSGTAHFFCHNFENSFRKLFDKTDNVIFEGPLDPVFMAQVEEAGKKLEPGLKPLSEMLTEEEILNLEKYVYGPQGKIAQCLGMRALPKIDVRTLLKTGRYWYVFFSVWTAFLSRQGWNDSVDMEAWRIARSMNKNIIGMENLEEQLAALGSLPVDRVVRFFRNCSSWKKRALRNRKAYLAGDLECMMGSSAEFPTHTEHVLDKRDQRFRERMRNYLEQGRTAVFVGSAHMVNLRHMLAEDGFRVRQKPFGIWPALHLSYRNHFRPDEKVLW